MILRTLNIFILTVGFFFLYSCMKDEVHPPDIYDAALSFPDLSANHPKKDQYQSLVVEYVGKGVLGTSIMIRDKEGTWLGTGGSSDLASGIPTQTGHKFLIASISKVMTAAVIFSMVDDGILTIEDPVSKWLDESLIGKVENADKATIKNLLAHTSGIHDYYTLEFEMARYNRQHNDWTHEEMLAYTYGKKAYFEVEAQYGYSNANFLLLGLIIEKATGQSLAQAYQNRIFNPLQLKNTYFDLRNPSNYEKVIKGYFSLYGRGYVESEFLYKDELGTGDGGIATNAQDLGTFFDALLKGNLISTQSLDQMKNWFDIEEGKNGYGLEYFEEEYGVSYGHTGGVDGFSSFANFYPEKDVTIIALFNFSPGSRSQFENLVAFREALDKIVLE